MSRIAKKPVEIISGAEVNVSGQTITAKSVMKTLPTFKKNPGVHTAIITRLTVLISTGAKDDAG